MPVPVIRLVRFCAANGMLTPKYARLALRYARRRLLTVAGWRWETSGLLFLGKRLEIQIARRGKVRFGRFVWIGDGTKINEQVFIGGVTAGEQDQDRLPGRVEVGTAGEVHEVIVAEHAGRVHVWHDRLRRRGDTGTVGEAVVRGRVHAQERSDGGPDRVDRHEER